MRRFLLYLTLFALTAFALPAAEAGPYGTVVTGKGILRATPDFCPTQDPPGDVPTSATLYRTVNNPFSYWRLALFAEVIDQCSYLAATECTGLGTFDTGINFFGCGALGGEGRLEKMNACRAGPHPDLYYGYAYLTFQNNLGKMMGTVELYMTETTASDVQACAHFFEGPALLPI